MSPDCGCSGLLLTNMPTGGCLLPEVAHRWTQGIEHAMLGCWHGPMLGGVGVVQTGMLRDVQALS